jgi:Flp pilus assembly protein TadB
MMIGDILNVSDDTAVFSVILLLAALGCIGVGLLVCMINSTVGDGVVRSLLEGAAGEDRSINTAQKSSLLFREERLRAWFLGAAIALGLALSLRNGGPAQIALYLGLGGVGGELVHRGARERKRKDRARRLEFYLPTAMERVVMAVSSGLDIIPALSEAARKSVDPVSDIFRAIVSLSEGGLRVEHAIQMTADSVPSSPVKHALVHLALAYTQGGEVMRPLKELSDATQTHYQESVEEEIAKLPVKAVLPLLLTFTGLIICFLTVPVLQVGASLEKFERATQ